MERLTLEDMIKALKCISSQDAEGDCYMDHENFKHMEDDKVIERRSHIKSDYQYMDDCNEKGCEWDNPWGVVEYETYKEYAEPLFKNLEDQHEVRRSRKDRKE